MFYFKFFALFITLEFEFLIPETRARYGTI
jgi:hypothetical protein